MDWWIVLVLAAVVVVVAIVAIRAKIFIGIVVVKEETAVAFEFLGRFHYMAMEFKNHYFMPDGSIEVGYGPNWYGRSICIWRWEGWVFYLSPFIKVVNYCDQNDPDKFGDGIYIHLGDTSPEPYVVAGETKKPENVALNATFATTMQIVNPYKFLFVSPRDVTSQILKRLEAVLRGWIRSGTEDHAQEARDNGVALWQGIENLGCKIVFDNLKDKWGLYIVPGSIVVVEVGYDADYQAALKAESQARLNAKAEVAKIAAIDQALEKWVAAQAKKRKMKVVDFLAMFKADVERQRDIYMSQILADAGADLLLVGNPDGTPIKGDLSAAIALFAAAGRAGDRGRGNRNKNRFNKKGGKRKGRDDDDDDDNDGLD